jgi:cytochrome c peroxidase
MSSSRIGFPVVVSAAAAALLAACEGPPSPTAASDVRVQTSALTAAQRLAACAQDPRVVTGLASQQVCAGADIFFTETFNGNGRTCGTCHPASNNTTIDPGFVSALHASNPSDPLFVFETNPALANLERGDRLFSNGVILENVDGFEDPTNKFVLRGVPHVLSMKTSVAADAGDGTTNPPIERTGWSGDGAPGDGSLRSFLTGAVTQHYTKTLARQPGVDFRVPTAQELDLTLAFQLALGRTNELDLSQVNLFDAEANVGRQAFLDPQRGRCNVCHLNAGANSQDTGKNRNFDTGTRLSPTASFTPTFDGVALFDGGFGGKGLAHVNFDASGDGAFDSFGNGTFNTPPLIEAVDTGPFFHNNFINVFFGSDIEDAVFFYVEQFTGSPADLALRQRFGTPIAFSSDEGFAIGRFLRALNVAFNLDLAKQRLRAVQTLFNRFGDTRVDLQIKLMQLAGAELDDALAVLTSGKTHQPFYPVSVDRIGLAKAEIAAAIAAPVSSRGGKISNAISRVENARDPIGANVTYQLGQGNLFF